MLTVVSALDVDSATNEGGSTVLWIAAYNGQVELVEALVKGGCDVDKADDDSDTPLLIAAEKGHGEVVAALIKGAGATWTKPTTSMAPRRCIVLLSTGMPRWWQR